MKIIIIGAKGMLGQELAAVFSESQPLLWDREEIDISNMADVQNKITAAQPDVVINAAAYNDVDGAEEKEALVNEINGYGPGYLAQALRTTGGILMHYSTDYVFRGDRQRGYGEDDQPDPQSAYARSKYLGEREVRKYSKRFYILRLSRLFGRPASSQLAKKSFVHVMLDLAQRRREIQVVDEELSSPTYALDLALASREIIEGNQPFGIYHTTNSGACTWFTFAQEIFKIKRLNPKLIPVNSEVFSRAAARPMYSVLLNTKRAVQRPWQEALREFLTDNV